jgi:hypothetical protein
MFFYIVSILILCFISATEILVFNEEVLLALCFICFIYFIYSISNESIASDFEQQTKKLTYDLLLALDKQMLIKLELYQDSKNVIQYGNQMDILYSAIMENFSYLIKMIYLLKETSISNSFTQEMSNIAKMVANKNKQIQSLIIEKYLYTSIFENKPITYLIDSNAKKDVTTLQNNIIYFIEIQLMD